MVRDSRGGYNRKKVDENFFTEWSPSMAYVLGLIYADGAVEDCRKSSRTCYLQITSQDRELLEEVQKVIGSDHQLYLKPSRISSIRGKDYRCNPLYNLRIGNVKIFEDLLLLGLCPRKSLIIELPSIPQEYFSFFLRGYFDGDGCVNVYSRGLNSKAIQVIFTSGSKLFLEKLNKEIGSCLNLSLKNITFQAYSYRLTYKANQAVSVCDFMYENLKKTPYLRRKHNIYQGYIRMTR